MRASLYRFGDEISGVNLRIFSGDVFVQYKNEKPAGWDTKKIISMGAPHVWQALSTPNTLYFDQKTFCGGHNLQGT